MKERSMEIRKEKITTYVAYVIICLSVIVTVSLLERLDIFGKIELSTHDLRFRIRGIEDHTDEIVIVAIDPQTLDFLGLTGVPPRDYHVRLIENLYRAGAKAVLLDILFLTYTGKQISDDYSMELGGTMSWRDSLFADTLFMYPNTVIARKQIVTMAKATRTSTGEPPLPIPEFRNHGQLAFVDMVLDSDKFVRRAQLIHNDTDPQMEWQYSFALRAAMFAMDADTAWVDTEKHRVFVGDKVVPLDERDTMVINFCMDEASYANSGGYISYEQVLDESGLQSLIETGQFKDKVVLVGAAYPESKDWESTPFYLGTKLSSSSEIPMYGVHVHKNIISTILDDRFIVPFSYWQTVILIVLIAIVSTFINYRFRGYGGLFLSIMFIVMYFITAVYFFEKKRLLVPIVAPSFTTVLLSYLSAVTYNFLTERRQKAIIRGAFAHYVPGKVVGELLKNPEMLTLGGEERVMTVLFSDVQGFTSISEKLSPTELVELLNEYLTAMTDIILSYDGIIDKYEGDAIMAEFGAPLPDEDHALKACLAAIDMQAKLKQMREKWKEEGRSELKARVGINSGEMVIGNMGSREIFDYTVMGDNVNLSSRLEGANKIYGTYIMCSEATKSFVDHAVHTRELDILRVKGKREGVKVYEILGKKSDNLDSGIQKLLTVYSQGLAAYKECRWQDGIDLFTEALSISGEDGPSVLYLERCNKFLINPPPEDWDGIFTMRTK
ncbi:MAG: adenylate/guanylate cyclase domain-containing protein [Candidatus Latescibacteria bacterium]|nr:adenylate/guanylate cyclase domain-containing protein [Candidatus Latescibacterota bacterium]